jgi:type VI protein secretion system component VasF
MPVAGRDPANDEAQPRRKDPTAPKGRPTYGRKQRQAEARRRAKRRQLKRRISWTVFVLVLIAIVVLLVVFEIGAVDPQV